MWPEFVVKRILGWRGEKLRDYFDDLDLEAVVPQLLQYVFGYGLCENVIWLTKEEMEKRTQATRSADEADVDQALYRHLRIQGLKPYNENLIDQLLGRLQVVPSGPLPLHNENRSHLLLPLKDVTGNETLAYLLFLDMPEQKVEKLKSQLSRDWPFLAKHVGFSLRHWSVQKMSFLDDLTHLYNQKYMSLVLESEIHRSQREEKKFSVLFMDVDYFKSVNDTRGHWVGSRLLVEIGRILKNHVRRSDYAFRYGGDEFVVVLPGTDAPGACIAAERLRAQVEKNEFLVEGESLKLTLSIGLATYPDHAKTYKDIIKMADEAMYCGKNKSRNIVFVAS